MVLKFVSFLLCALFVSGFPFEGPCDILPDRDYDGIPSWDHSVNITVPSRCRTGMFEWHHPRGYTLVTFNNNNRMATSICVRDFVGGEIFRITDPTDSSIITVEYDTNNWNCTLPTTSREIVLRVSLPKEIRYMGAFEYELRSTRNGI